MKKLSITEANKHLSEILRKTFEIEGYIIEEYSELVIYQEQKREDDKEIEVIRKRNYKSLQSVNSHAVFYNLRNAIRIYYAFSLSMQKIACFEIDEEKQKEIRRKQAEEVFYGSGQVSVIN